MFGEYSDYSEEDLRLEKQHQRWLETRPICDWCLERIEEDTAYEIDGQLICESCIEEYMEVNHRVRIPD